MPVRELIEGVTLREFRELGMRRGISVVGEGATAPTLRRPMPEASRATAA